MARVTDEDLPEVYQIPDNFDKAGYIQNTNLKLRNALEGGVLAAGGAFIAWNLPIESFTVRVSVALTIALPLLLIGIIGVNGDPLSNFLKNAMHWFQSKRIMLFNGKVATRSTRPVETILNQELPRDKIVYALDAMKKKNGERSDQILVEGRDFVFDEDIDFQREKRASEEKGKKALKAEQKAAKKQAAADKKAAKEKAKADKKALKAEKKNKGKKGAPDDDIVEENRYLDETAEETTSSTAAAGYYDDEQPDAVNEEPAEPAKQPDEPYDDRDDTDDYEEGSDDDDGVLLVAGDLEDEDEDDYEDEGEAEILEGAIIDEDED